MSGRETPDDHTWLDAGFVAGGRLMLIYFAAAIAAAGWLIS
jgi:hypothetical protein